MSAGSINAFLERQDDVVDLFGYYKYSVKTSLFLQYRYMAVEHDTATEKITGKCRFTYENADYTQLAASNREDDTFEVRPSVEYLFKDWLMGELAYSYETRDSSDELFDYDTNTVLFSLNFAL